MTNTEKLIADLTNCKKNGITYVDFMVGKYTGNGSSVVSALKRRGFDVTKVPSGRASCYRLKDKE
jgi:hypothetical protein